MTALFLLCRVLAFACCGLVGVAGRLLLAEDAADFSVQLDVVKQELHPDYCWFHPRVAAVPGAGKEGQPLVVLTIQKHLVADDHYSGLHYMTTSDLGKT